jgi:hypothetical protein
VAVVVAAAAAMAAAAVIEIINIFFYNSLKKPFNKLKGFFMPVNQRYPQVLSSSN